MNPRYRIIAEEQLSDDMAKDLFREQTIIHLETRGRTGHHRDFLRELGEVHVAPGRLEDFMTAIENSKEDRAKSVWYVVHEVTIISMPYPTQGGAKQYAKEMAAKHPEKTYKVVRMIAEYMSRKPTPQETLYR